MVDISTLIFYVFLFLQTFMQILLLLYVLDDATEEEEVQRDWTPSVSIIVPCFNEEATVEKTITSLLALNYPKESLQIIAVDDGSVDKTWQALQPFSNNSQVTLLQKENEGSKYRALNYALAYVTGDVVGCLDADSRVDEHALRYSVTRFTSERIAAVVPTIVIDQPTGFLRHMQKVEYEIGISVRRALAKMQALYITPGPFSLFRTEVLRSLGGYSFAHHTEDLDIALRLHKNDWKIAYAKDSLVFTVCPNTFGTLLKQRVRWLTGFLRNMIDYKDMLFAKKHGSLGILVLPYALFSILIFLYIAPHSLYTLGQSQLSHFSFTGWLNVLNGITPLFYIGITVPAIIGTSSILILAVLLFHGRHLSKKRLLSADILTISVYPIFASIWSLKAIADVLLSRKTTWR